MAAPVRFYSGLTGRAREYRDALGNDRGCRSEFGIREMVIPIKYTDGTAEFATNFKFPSPSIELNTRLYVRTAEAGGTTKQISIGTATADSGTPNSFLNLVDVSATGIRWLGLTQPIAVTVGSSPFTYTSVGAQQVFITGGTVSSVVLKRGGTSITIGSATGLNADMEDGDQLVVTYSVLPTMTAFQEEGDTLTNIGGKRVSWTPASANFTTLDADILIEYLVFGDLTQFQTSGEAVTQGVG